MHIVSLILQINLADYQYRLVAVLINRGGEFNAPKLAVIHSNSKVNILLHMNDAKLLKAFALRR